MGQIYTWDAESRIASARTTSGTVSYKYDSDGNLVYKTGGPSGTFMYYRDAAGRIAFSGTPGGNPGATGTTEAYVDGDLVGNWVNSSFSWVGHDQVGTKRYESTGTGSGLTAVPVFGHSDTSLPFGDATVSTPATDYDPLHFTGKEKDPDTGDDYFGARYYSSGMGRFMSPDWAAKAEPVPYAKLDDPQSLNLYEYVRNNPSSGVDPDGHSGGKGDFTTDCDTGIITQCSQGTQAAAASQQQAQQQSEDATVPVVVGQRPIQNKVAQFFSLLFTGHKAYHSYYRLAGDDGITHQFEVLGNPGSSKNQQVRDTYDPTGGGRMSHGTEHTVYATEAQAAALINRSEYFESRPCPVCTGGQEGYNLVFHNSNSYVYNMLRGAPGGGIPVPAAPFITPGYARRPDDWY